MKFLVTAALAGLAFGCAPGAASSNDSIEIVIEHSRFRPSQVEVAAGTTVTFVIRNDDPIAHEFILGDAEVQSVHEQGTEAHHGDKPGEVSIAAGATATTTYTFGAPGELIIGCHLPGHYDYGMRGAVEVK
ncbi:MAG: cupredoxin domain-containing protein [Actinobacteria bacterium]|nr:cupredoxin domain-containing protein [Actinomycetota bacterium]